jgi:hypothetical protein
LTALRNDIDAQLTGLDFMLGSAMDVRQNDDYHKRSSDYRAWFFDRMYPIQFREPVADIFQRSRAWGLVAPDELQLFTNPWNTSGLWAVIRRLREVRAKVQELLDAGAPSIGAGG